MNIFRIIFSILVYSLSVHAVELDFLGEANRWGEPPCATCAEMENAQELPRVLNEAQTYALSHQQLKAMKPFYIDNPPSDFKNEWCPKYQSFDADKKLEVWSWVFTRMAYYESSYISDKKYDEGQTDSNLRGVVSTGILQISFNSSQARPYLDHGCPIKDIGDLVHPQKNIGCGVAMVAALIKRDGCFTCDTKKGAGAYWSVLRKPYTVRSGIRRIHLGKKDKIMEYVKEKMPGCF